MREEVLQYLNAGYPALWIEDWDDSFVTKELAEIAKKGKLGGDAMGIKVWSCSKGFVDLNTKKVENKTDPLVALKWVDKADDYTLYVFQNFHFYTGDPQIIQQIKDLIPLAKERERQLVFVSCEAKIPPELEREIPVFSFGLPQREHMEAVMDELLESINAGAEEDGKSPVKVGEFAKEKMAEAALGLTRSEAENAFALAYVKHKEFGEQAVETVRTLKTKYINKTEVLEYVEHEGDLSDVGGLALLKEWLMQRKRAFTPEAKAFGVPTPKGLLLAGVAGSGKSLAAKACAAAWGIPLLRFDVGKVFNSLVGESEKRMRDALKIAEAMSPCVLWIDEIDKAFSGSVLDSGLSSRLFGHFLSWMQEKSGAAFVFATANNVSALPPEFLRKGRFDEFFFVDLPNAEERSEIFKIHLAKAKRDAEGFNVEFMVRESDGYSGSEIESAVHAGLIQAFFEGRELAAGDILKALKETTPLSVTMQESVQQLRDWARTRARKANGQIQQQEETGSVVQLKIQK